MVPEEQITLIEPHPKWSLDDLKEIWRHRELLWVFVDRDIRVRYKQTAIGILWAIIQPLSTMLIFTVIFSRFSSTGNIPYPLFSYLGLLLWTYFSGAIGNSSASLVGSSSLITKVYFPRAIIPISAVMVGIIDLLVASFLTGGLFLYYHYVPPITSLLSLFSILGTILLATGFGLLLSAVNVKYRDIKYAVPFFLSLGIFVTPVIYPLTDAPHLRLLLSLNPMTGYIESFRSFILNTPLDLTSYVSAWVITILICLYGWYYFRSVERYFSDLL